ncbi:MAG: RNA polymerase sigma factor [Phycisphaeraceae bacterium]|nr:RNA polymerase sigma factor [Phycisphaeraceae bacterium]
MPVGRPQPNMREPTSGSSRPTSTAPDAARAVASLVDSHGPRLHALALRLCRHRADAEDMVQDVFLQALRKWHTFRGESDPGTWLYTIAARTCKARTRRKGGIDKRQVPMSQLMPWSETTVMEAAAAPEGREDPAEKKEALARVQEQIARLPEHLRLPLVLKEVLGMSVEDAAAALGLEENTIKTRLHRARLALRKAMTAKASRVSAPAPIYEKQVCLDLLKAKMEAMDRGGIAAGQRVPQAEVCARCRAVFRELDMVQDACSQMGQGDMPAPLRAKILDALRTREDTERASGPRRGRRPVRAHR